MLITAANLQHIYHIASRDVAHCEPVLRIDGRARFVLEQTALERLNDLLSRLLETCSWHIYELPRMNQLDFCMGDGR